MIARGLLITVFCALCVVGYGAQPIIDTDFGADDAYRKVETFDKQAKPVATGRLPKGWNDNSSWAKVKVHYDRAVDGGRAFLRLDVTEFVSGRGQITYDLKGAGEKPYLRLTFSLRNPGGQKVDIGIRAAGPPYGWFWKQSGVFSPEWREYQYDIEIPKPDVPVRFFIMANGEGAVDIERLRLEGLTSDEMATRVVEAYRRNHPEPLPRNRFRITRMPLGLQNGWAVWREKEIGTDIVVASDPDVVGPSGAPSLHVHVLDPTKQSSLFTAPMGWVVPLKKHVASFYVCGKMKGKVQAISGRHVDGSKSVDLDTHGEWQRVVVPFKPRLHASNVGLRIIATGDFHLDAFQAEEGSEPTSYAPAAPCEVALTCPESETSVARIQFEDEKAEVRYCVAGAPGVGACLRTRLTNVYGETKDLPSVPLENRGLQYGMCSFDAFGDRPYGSFRIEAWVEDATGKRISTFNEIVIHRLRRPRYDGRDAPDSPFGVHTLPRRRHLLMAKAVGINWVRLHDAGLQYIGWYFLEREPGKWTFFDDKIQAYRKQHLKILGEFGTAPEWASYVRNTTEPCKSEYRRKWFAPTDPDQFGNYCRVVAKRYKGAIDDWCMWNEPWGTGFFAFDYNPSKVKRGRGFTQPDTAPAYHAELTRQAWINGRAANPDIRIAGVCTTQSDEPDSMASRWTRGIVDADGLEWCNAYDYHHYLDAAIGFPGDTIERTVRNAFAPVVEKKGGIDKPLWMTEGQPVKRMTSTGLYKYTVVDPAPDDIWPTSDRLARYMVRMLAVGIQRVFLYTMHGHHYFNDDAKWSVLVTPEGYLHPSGAAHSALAWLIEDTRYARTVQVSENVWAYLFQGHGRAVAAICPSATDTGYTLPKHPSIRYLDLFGNPLHDRKVMGYTVYAVIEEPASWLAEQLQRGRP